MIRNKQDLTQIFDSRWKASHNNDVKDAKSKQKAFFDKMFDSLGEKPIGNMQDEFNRLNQNIANTKEARRQSRINNLKGKF